MQTKILTKVLEELGKESPDLSYIRGMIETLVSLSPDEIALENFKPVYAVGSQMLKKEPVMDEGATLDAMARASLETIKSLADKSTEVA